MRIVSGKYRGRRLQPPVGLPVRPTTDFAKEGLFNVLNNIIDFESIRVLDLFTGTGSISFEFLSRGAVEVTSVDSNFKCIDFIKKTADIIGINNLKPVKSNVFGYLKHPFGRFDLIFADPPYDLEGIGDLPDQVLESGMLADDGLFIMEHSIRLKYETHPCFVQKRVYGSVNFSFFRKS